MQNICDMILLFGWYCLLFGSKSSCCKTYSHISMLIHFLKLSELLANHCHAMYKYSQRFPRNLIHAWDCVDMFLLICMSTSILWVHAGPQACGRAGRSVGRQSHGSGWRSGGSVGSVGDMLAPFPERKEVITVSQPSWLSSNTSWVQEAMRETSDNVCWVYMKFHAKKHGGPRTNLQAASRSRRFLARMG